MTSNLNQMKSKRDDSSHWFRIRVTENGTRLDPKVVLLNLCILDPIRLGKTKRIASSWHITLEFAHNVQCTSHEGKDTIGMTDAKIVQTESGV